MSNIIIIDTLTKCRLESIFGDGTYLGCFTIAKLIMAVGMTGLVMLALGIIFKINGGRNNGRRKKRR